MRYEKAYPAPAGAVRAEVGAGLPHCTVRAWFDDLAVSLLDTSGKRFTAKLVSEQRTDQIDWQAFVPGQGGDAVALDLSSLNETPAGKHGFHDRAGGRYVFAREASVEAHPAAGQAQRASGSTHPSAG
jgi:hypothetical protein